MKAFEVAEQIARDTSCAQGEFKDRVLAIIPYLTEHLDEIERLKRELSYRVHTDEDIKVQNAEIERLRNENAHLQFCLNSRDDFLGRIGQWQAYVDTLPEKKAGVPGGWSENPSVTTEQKGQQ